MTAIQPGSYYPIDLDQLPQSWKVVYLGDAIADVQSGFPSGRHNKEGQGIPHLRPMNVDRQGRLDLSDVKYVLPDVDEARINSGDVLFNNTNSPELIGKTTTVTSAGEWAFSNHMTRLRPPAGIDSRFVAYQLHYLWMSGYFRHRCTHHVNQASIAASTLAASVPLILSPSREQDRIVAEIEKQFTRLDDAVIALKRVQTNLKRYRASVLKAACEGRLVSSEAELARQEGRDYEPASELLKRILAERRAKWEADQLQKMIAAGKPPKDDEWRRNFNSHEMRGKENLSHLPEGWIWTSVSDVGAVQLGRQRAPKHHTGTFMRPYLRVANVFEDRIDIKGVLEMNFTPTEFETYQLHAGDILLNEGQSLEWVGRSAIYNDELPGGCFQNTLVRFSSFEGVLQKYAQLVFLHYLHSRRFQRIARWTVNIAHLGAERFANLEFPLPPLSEQKRIIEEVDRLNSDYQHSIATLKVTLAKTSRLRHAILSAAFSGKLVPQDPNDEPASMLLERIRAGRAALATKNGNQKVTKKPLSANNQRQRRVAKLAQGVSPGKAKKK